MKIKTVDVFKTQGVPTHTYVSVSDGTVEDQLETAITSKGTICLVTGPSKTGKTTLVASVCKSLHLIPLTIRCTQDLSPEQFWRQALEQLDFSRVTLSQKEISTKTKIGTEIGGKIGWGWLAQMTGKVTGALTKKRSEQTAKERILAAPGPEHLIPVLKYLGHLLVVEDFHYLSQETQTSVFQQWKVFVDGEVSVAILGTTHRAADLAFANKDLLGRIYHLEISTWTHEDLSKIAKKGFSTLKVRIDPSVIAKIADESVGLPLLTQAICLELALSRKILEEGSKEIELKIDKSDVFSLLTSVARKRFGPLEVVYERISKGLRTRKKRKYNTYECLLLVFTLDPIVYQLAFKDIEARLNDLPLKPEARPPALSLKSALARLAQLQSRMEVNVLEWYPKDEKLYIIEPSFLFYLRWRTPRSVAPTIKDLFLSFASESAQVYFPKDMFKSTSGVIVIDTEFGSPTTAAPPPGEGGQGDSEKTEKP